MTSLVFGLPGSGKSTFLARCASLALSGKGVTVGLFKTDLCRPGKKRVFSNYPVKGCYKLDVENLGLFDFSNSLILLDEVSLFADSRNFRQFSENMKFFFCLQRHYNIDVVCCSQSYMDCDVKIRRLCDNFFLVRSRLGRAYVSPIKQTIDVSCGTINEEYSLKGLLHSTFVSYKKYSGLFDSYERPKLPQPSLEMW